LLFAICYLLFAICYLLPLLIRKVLHRYGVGIIEVHDISAVRFREGIGIPPFCERIFAKVAHGCLSVAPYYIKSTLHRDELQCGGIHDLDIIEVRLADLIVVDEAVERTVLPDPVLFCGCGMVCSVKCGKVPAAYDTLVFVGPFLQQDRLLGSYGLKACFEI